MAFDHQDWNTVVFRKHTSAKPADAKSKDAIKVAQRAGLAIDTVVKDHHREEKDRARKLEQETAVLPKLSIAMRKLMTEARTKKNMTRDQLAQRLNVKPKMIADMESGVVVTDLTLLTKVKRELGIPELRFE